MRVIVVGHDMSGKITYIFKLEYIRQTHELKHICCFLASFPRDCNFYLYFC
jgi:hypothetical protein